MQNISTLTVRRKPGYLPHKGIFIAGNQSFDCLLGRGGIGVNKIEGDGKTPAGCFSLLYGFFRKDRILSPTNRLAMRGIEPSDGWCDAPEHPNYNEMITRPLNASHETMNRADHLYDICLVMDYNIFPRARYRGSAVFFHLASPEGKATEGCIALPLSVMQKLLPRLARYVVIKVLG
ncbi:MAG: L,D-transpeptidase family protein [Rhizobiaceae bacterium]